MPCPTGGVGDIVADLQEGVRPEDPFERERDTAIGLDARTLEIRCRVRSLTGAQDDQAQARAGQPTRLLRRYSRQIRSFISRGGRVEHPLDQLGG